MNRLIFLMLAGFGLIGCSHTEKNFLDTDDACFGLRPPDLIPEVFEELRKIEY